MTPPRLYRYVGSESARANAEDYGPGARITSRVQFAKWVAAHPEAVSEAATYVVDEDGVLRLAPRRSEHVACAQGGAVMAAGEIAFAWDLSRVAWCSNQSSGYCPEPSSWGPLCAALGALGVAPPEAFTPECVWRRCDECGQITLVKNDSFDCAVCGEALPLEWNFAPAP